MKVQLTRSLIPFLTAQGHSLDRDGHFRCWNANRTICSIVSIFAFDSGDRFSVDIGFYSPQFAEWFGLSPTLLPKSADCASSGYFFRLDEFAGKPLQSGWRIDSASDTSTAQELLSLLSEKFPHLMMQFMTFAGWEAFARERVAAEPARKGYWWAMIGYATLMMEGDREEDFACAIKQHQNQTARTGRLQYHIDHQIQIGINRFGADFSKLLGV